MDSPFFEQVKNTFQLNLSLDCKLAKGLEGLGVNHPLQENFKKKLGKYIIIIEDATGTEIGGLKSKNKISFKNLRQDQNLNIQKKDVLHFKSNGKKVTEVGLGFNLKRGKELRLIKMTPAEVNIELTDVYIAVTHGDNVIFKDDDPLMYDRNEFEISLEGVFKVNIIFENEGFMNDSYFKLLFTSFPKSIKTVHFDRIEVNVRNKLQRNSNLNIEYQQNIQLFL